MDLNRKEFDLFQRSSVRGMAMRVFMPLCLMLMVVQPWKLPIEGLKAPFIIEVTQGALGAPANEEETKEKANEKIQDRTEELSLVAEYAPGKLQIETKLPFPGSPFFEVPTPPPRG